MPYSAGVVSHQLQPTVADVGADPSTVTINADGTLAYVSHLDNTVSIVDITPGAANPYSNLQPVTTIQAGAFATPVGITTGGVDVDYPIALTPDGTRAYVIHPDGTIAVIDTTDDKVISSFTASKNPTASVLGIAFDPTSTHAYILTSDNKLTVVTIAPVTPPSTVTTTSGEGSVDV